MNSIDFLISLIDNYNNFHLLINDFILVLENFSPSMFDLNFSYTNISGQDFLTKINEDFKTITYDQETGEVIENNANIKFKHIKRSTIDPDAGFYHKGEHEKQFAYSASALCDKNGFILDAYITSGNIHDSISFKGLFDNYKNHFLYESTDLFCFDSGYNSPSVIKTILDEDKDILIPYSRPKTKNGFFKKYEYVYDDLNDAYICPNNEFLHYSTTNKKGYREYKSNPEKCKSCPFLKQCTESKNHVKLVTQHVWNEYIEKLQILDIVSVMTRYIKREKKQSKNALLMVKKISV